ncbi:MAG: class I SAM-dependent methyltransferase [Oligoflexales bacterium]|nr:class I SAM-dependent methyltransferase [Oligoflexales bacterium]
MTQQIDSKPHSHDFFGEWRDFWWNMDFIELMSKRWRLAEIGTVLDVGCGVGHWGRVLFPFFTPSTKITGIDMEAESIQKCIEIANQSGISERCKYMLSKAEALPFPDNSFDMVTCQTVLIHVPDPKRALREMIRVLKPGGLIAVAEPNNVASNLIETSLSFDDPLETKMKRVRFALICEKGKASLGLGHNSIGDMLPSLFAAERLDEIQVYLSDKAAFMIPPYNTPAEQANIRQASEWVNQEFFMWSHAETKQYFLAGGGTDEEFETCWNELRVCSNKFLSSIKAESFHATGAAIFYLVSGRKNENW